jgi:two-component system chemotaxis response regulator CheB
VQPIQAVAIAISTGGPSALIDLVSGLDSDLPVPIFITQHMPPMFTKFLAERLTVRGRLPAFEAEHGMPVAPGSIYIAPGDFHLEVRSRDEELFLSLSQAPAENSCRPSADVMFRSLADVYGGALLGIVMTGMGQDGRRGCEEIKARGGLIVAQDEASSLVWGMPRAVYMAGLHDAVAPLGAISAVINRACKKSKEEK